MAITRYPVKHSSNVKSIGYDSNEKILEVEFSGGGVYQYKNVEPELHADLMAASSKGKFLNKRIVKKPKKYPFTKQ